FTNKKGIIQMTIDKISRAIELHDAVSKPVVRSVDFAFAVGRLAYAKDHLISSCPYPQNSTFAIHWRAGWYEERFFQSCGGK
ncbi:MAG: hypothetical protein KGJ13_05100, partial [Patescibacteria group bacterium]|nr:hypothetical protein [Patescibacteria group bacterium]